MWFVGIRILFWLLVLIVLVYVTRKSDAKYRKRFRVLSLFIVVVGYILSGFLLVENYIVTFSSPESVYRYSHLGEPDIVLDGEQSSMVIAVNGGTSTIVTIPKCDGGWKLDSGLGQKHILFETINTAGIIVYRYRNTNDYYIIISDFSEEPLQIWDENGSMFKIDTYDVKGTELASYSYCAYIKEHNGNYVLNINGEAYNLSF